MLLPGHPATASLKKACPSIFGIQGPFRTWRSKIDGHAFLAKLVYPQKQNLLR